MSCYSQMRGGTPVGSARFAGTPRRLCTSRNKARAGRGARGRGSQTTAQWEHEDDVVEESPSPVPMVSSSLRQSVSSFYDSAVHRALADPFVPYENISGIINLGECDTSDGWSPNVEQDAPDMTMAELVDATVAELTGLFGQSGVEAAPALALGVVAPGIGGIYIVGDDSVDGGDSIDNDNTGTNPTINGTIGSSSGGGFVWCKLTQFQGSDDWEGEAELCESLVETYGVLLTPGMLRGTSEPGWFLMCVAGRDEETLLTGVDRLRTQLTQRKFLHGRW